LLLYLYIALTSFKTLSFPEKVFHGDDYSKLESLYWNHIYLNFLLFGSSGLKTADNITSLRGIPSQFEAKQLFPSLKSENLV